MTFRTPIHLVSWTPLVLVVHWSDYHYHYHYPQGLSRCYTSGCCCGGCLVKVSVDGVCWRWRCSWCNWLEGVGVRLVWVYGSYTCFGISGFIYILDGWVCLHAAWGFDCPISGIKLIQESCSMHINHSNILSPIFRPITNLLLLALLRLKSVTL